MSVGLVGKKCGMTRVFDDSGRSIPVTVVEIAPNHISQLKTMDKNGYCAVQIATGPKKSSRLNKPESGHLAKAGVEASDYLCEFKLEADEASELNLGEALPLTTFAEGQAVDVRGVCKGKGFAGVIKRHNFSMQDATHGNSLSHRAPGSIGQCQFPGRVFKGKKMAGQMGNVNRTIQNLTVVKVDTVRSLLLIEGAVPGAPGGYVVVTASIKAKNKGGN